MEHSTNRLFSVATGRQKWILRSLGGAIVVGCLLVYALSTHGQQHLREPLLEIAHRVTKDLTAGNSTLGFEAILALSRGTQWRVDGLKAAANASKITIQIPVQPRWSDPFVEAFQHFGPVEAHGAALAWLGHIDLLKLIIQTRLGSALILEDDVDWSVDIRTQASLMASHILSLTNQKASSKAPYGAQWDLLWLGHCSDPPSKPYVIYEDNTTAPIEAYAGIDPYVKSFLKDGERMVHFSSKPVCSWAYAVTAASAPIVLGMASEGKGGAYDLMLMKACREKELRCITANPQLFDTYHPGEGDVSEVRAGDAGLDPDADSKVFGLSMGHTNNIVDSARCEGLWHVPCIG